MSLGLYLPKLLKSERVGAGELHMKKHEFIASLVISGDFDGNHFLGLHRNSSAPTFHDMCHYATALLFLRNHLCRWWKVTKEGLLFPAHGIELGLPEHWDATITANDSSNLAVLATFAEALTMPTVDWEKCTQAEERELEIKVDFPKIAPPGHLDHLMLLHSGTLCFKRLNRASQAGAK